MFDLQNAPEYAALFTRNFLELVSEGKHRTFVRSLLRRSKSNLRVTRNLTLARFLDKTYTALSDRYRCEYVYKNEIVNRIVFEKHSPRTTATFTEFGVLDCKADLVIVNGKATAYEIKTELDSLARLRRQVEAYGKVFDEVVVVTHKSQLDIALRLLPPNVGIAALTTTNKLRFRRRPTSDLGTLDKEAIFNLLRRAEYISVIQKEFGSLPDMPNTRYYSYCKERFVELPIELIYTYFVEILHSRNRYTSLGDFIHEVPSSLRALSVTAPITKRDSKAIQNALREGLV